jgi:hypothetical protein
MAYNVLKGVLILLIIGLIVYAIVITIQIAKPKSCPPPNCPPQQQCGKSIPADNQLIKNIENLSNNGAQFAYSGYQTIEKNVPVIGDANAFMMLTFKTCNKCEYSDNPNGTIIYRGTADLCNCSNHMNFATSDVSNYSGACTIAYVLTLITNKQTPLLHFAYKFGECSEIVKTKLGSINSIMYNMEDDQFNVSLTTLKQSIIPSEMINITLSNDKLSNLSNTFKTDLEKTPTANEFCKNPPSGVKNAKPVDTNCI